MFLVEKLPWFIINYLTLLLGLKLKKNWSSSANSSRGARKRRWFDDVLHWFNLVVLRQYQVNQCPATIARIIISDQIIIALRCLGAILHCYKCRQQQLALLGICWFLLGFLEVWIVGWNRINHFSMLRTSNMSCISFIACACSQSKLLPRFWLICTAVAVNFRRLLFFFPSECSHSWILANLDSI